MVGIWKGKLKSYLVYYRYACLKKTRNPHIISVGVATQIRIEQNSMQVTSFAPWYDVVRYTGIRQQYFFKAVCHIFIAFSNLRTFFKLMKCWVKLRSEKLIHSICKVPKFSDMGGGYYFSFLSQLNTHSIFNTCIYHQLQPTLFMFLIPVVFYANEGGWVRQNTTVVGSYLLVRRWRHVSAVLGHLQVIN